MDSAATPIQSGNSLGATRCLSGPLVLVESYADLETVTDGDVAYIPRSANTTNNVVLFYNLIRAGARAILCETIGRTDHGVLLANELSVPCLSDISRAIDRFEGDHVTIRGETIYLGDCFTGESYEQGVDAFAYPDTKTAIAVNIGFPEVIDRNSALPAITDGVGFMRLEFALLDILQNTHPKSFIERHGREQLVTDLADRIEPVLDAFDDPVWIRTDDFSVCQLANMDGGEQYEQSEENPMLGWRGVARSNTEPTLYEVQLDAIKRLSERSHQQIGLFPPMTRFPREYADWKEQAMDAGLEDVSFGIMIETPAAALTFEKVVDDVSFVVFGSNDLTQFTLAIDRNNDRLRSKYDETAAAMLTLFERVISIANDHGVESCIAGQAASNHELIEELVSFGIDRLSVNPDYETVSETKQFLAALEGE